MDEWKKQTSSSSCYAEKTTHSYLLCYWCLLILQPVPFLVRYHICDQTNWQKKGIRWMKKQTSNSSCHARKTNQPSDFFSTFVINWGTKGQLNSEWICEVIVSPKMPNKNLMHFCHRSLLEGRAEILQIFGWHFGRNDDLINSFWI